jgi:hypothetical protein
MSGMTTEITSPTLDNWVATPFLSTQDLDAALLEIAQVIGDFWSARLERPLLIPEVTLVSGQMLIHFTNGLTEQERAFVATPEGANAVVKELHRKLDLLYPVLAERVEQLLNCFVAESHLTVDSELHSIDCVVTLRDLPRIIAL